MTRRVFLLRLVIFFVAGAAGTVVCSCGTTDSGHAAHRRYVPQVLMPTDLNRNEEELLPEVADALRRAGFETGSGRDADYVLGFSVEDGPINADTRLRLQHGRREVARSFARVGGPRIFFKRRQVIHESFDKALRDFESQLPRFGGSDPLGSSWDGRGSGSDRGYADDAAGVERGEPYQDQR